MMAVRVQMLDDSITLFQVQVSGQARDDRVTYFTTRPVRPDLAKFRPFTENFFPKKSKQMETKFDPRFFQFVGLRDPTNHGIVCSPQRSHFIFSTSTSS
jgi:hypothetical protein